MMDKSYVLIAMLLVMGEDFSLLYKHLLIYSEKSFMLAVLLLKSRISGFD